MVYIDSFKFLNADQEWNFTREIQMTCFDTYYPFQILTKNRLEYIQFAPVTILYGGNGSGKSTALNIIAEKLNVKRESNFNKSNFFQDYVRQCEFEINREIPLESCIIRSDDIFDYMLNVRSINDGVDIKREELFEAYQNLKFRNYQLKSIKDIEEFKQVNDSKRLTQSKFTRKNTVDNIREYSNGESAFKYFTEKITENALYILDEPENSLSPKKQLELKQHIEESVRFFDCQFIISTHSPFLLSIFDAKIYNLDVCPVSTEKWTELENVREYYEFFKRTEGQFNC